jgi:hypothetical protein
MYHSSVLTAIAGGASVHPGSSVADAKGWAP